MYSLGTIYEFKTAQFRVVVDAVEEDSLDLSWDDSGETQRGLDSGKYIAFCARARVIHDYLGEIGSDYLGNCIYYSLEDFKTRDGYMPDMVHRAISEARERIANLKNIRIRTE
jgi:hypothetical protein